MSTTKRTTGTKLPSGPIPQPKSWTDYSKNKAHYDSGGSTPKDSTEQLVADQVSAGFAGYGRKVNPDGSVSYVDSTGKVVGGAPSPPSYAQTNTRTRVLTMVDREGTPTTKFTYKEEFKPEGTYGTLTREEIPRQYFYAFGTGQKIPVKRTPYGGVAPLTELAIERAAGVKSFETKITISRVEQEQKSFFGRKGGFTETVRTDITPLTPAATVMTNKMLSGNGLITVSELYTPRTVSFQQSFSERGESFTSRAMRRGDEMFKTHPVSFLARGWGKVMDYAGENISEGFYRKGSADDWLRYGLYRVGEKPLSSLVGVASVVLTRGRIIGLPVAGMAGANIVADYREWKNPEMARLARSPRVLSALSSTEYAGKEYTIIPGLFSVPGLSRIKDIVSLKGYGENLRSELILRGYEGSVLTQALSAGLYERRTRQQSLFVASVVGAEGAGNIVGSRSLAASQRLFSNVRSGALRNTLSYGTGIGVGGVSEGSFYEFSRQRIEREPYNLKRVAFAGALGGVTAGSFGGFMGYAKSIGPKSYAATEFVGNWFLDAPAEPIGDVITNLYTGRLRVPTFAPSSSFSPSSSQWSGPIIDVTASPVSDIVPRSKKVKSDFFFSRPAPSPVMSLTDSRVPVFSSSLTPSRSSSMVPVPPKSFVPAKTFAPVPSPVISPSSSIVPVSQESFTFTPQKSFVPTFSPSNSFVPSNVPVDVPVPTSDFPFSFFPGLSGKRGGGSRRERGYRYLPSITALFGGIKGGSGRSAFTTGLELRPIVGGAKKRRKKKRR